MIWKQPFVDLFKIGVVKNVANFKGKHLCWTLILTKLQVQACNLVKKRDINTGVFL